MPPLKNEQLVKLDQPSLEKTTKEDLPQLEEHQKQLEKKIQEVTEEQEKLTPANQVKRSDLNNQVEALSKELAMIKDRIEILKKGETDLADLKTEIAPKGKKTVDSQWSTAKQNEIAAEIAKEDSSVHQVKKGETLGAIILGMKKRGVEVLKGKNIYGLEVEYRSDKLKGAKKPKIMSEANLIYPGQFVWLEGNKVIVSDVDKAAPVEEEVPQAGQPADEQAPAEPAEQTAEAATEAPAEPAKPTTEAAPPTAADTRESSAPEAESPRERQNETTNIEITTIINLIQSGNGGIDKVQKEIESVDSQTQVEILIEVINRLAESKTSFEQAQPLLDLAIEIGTGDTKLIESINIYISIIIEQGGEQAEKAKEWREIHLIPAYREALKKKITIDREGEGLPEESPESNEGTDEMSSWIEKINKLIEENPELTPDGVLKKLDIKMYFIPASNTPETTHDTTKTNPFVGEWSADGFPEAGMTIDLTIRDDGTLFVMISERDGSNPAGAGGNGTWTAISETTIEINISDMESITGRILDKETIVIAGEGKTVKMRKKK